MLAAAISHAAAPWAKLWFGAANIVGYGFYLVVPSYSLFEKKAAKIHSNLCIGWSDLEWLGMTLLYTVLISAMFFALAALALRHRRHI